MTSVHYKFTGEQYLPRLDNADNNISKFRFALLLWLLPYRVLKADRSAARLLRAQGAGYFLRSYFDCDQVRDIRAAVRTFNAPYLLNALSQNASSPSKMAIIADSEVRQ